MEQVQHCSSSFLNHGVVSGCVCSSPWIERFEFFPVQPQLANGSKSCDRSPAQWKTELVGDVRPRGIGQGCAMHVLSEWNCGCCSRVRVYSELVTATSPFSWFLKHFTYSTQLEFSLAF